MLERRPKRSKSEYKLSRIVPLIGTLQPIGLLCYSEPMTRRLRIATRNSPLAMWQAEHVAALLAAREISSVLVPLVSRGDIDMRPIDGTRQIGLFTKRIQQALVDDEADIAVHSLKDLPTIPDQRFELAAIPERADVRDAIVSNQHYTIETLPDNAMVGTGSKRRAAQLLACRPDLRIMPIRGNLQTRLAKLDNGDFAGILLAEAGLLRMGYSDLNRHLMSTTEMLPAPGQGALGIEVRSDDDEAVEAVRPLSDPAAAAAVTAERRALRQLDGGCLAPIAALAMLQPSPPRSDSDRSNSSSPLALQLRCLAMSPDGSQRIDETDTIDFDPQSTTNWISNADELGRRVSQRMIEAGALQILRP